MVTWLIPLLLGVAPALFWLIFFLIEDKKRPEPKVALLRVFIVGVLSAILAAAIQKSLNIGFFDYSIITLLIFALIEEVTKFIGVYFAVSGKKFFDEPVDAMIYMITAAMGFAALENVLTLIEIRPIFEITILRFIGATLLHAIASGLVGFYWMKRKLVRGLMVATLLHAGFNYLILQLPGVEIYATSILIVAGLFLFYDFDLIKRSFRK
ncbi:MAG: PrsW family intramembrane metalloprotease [Candidatus Colwellbacteria bacterium]|nr:PrsW family intramembrane metalloprotease [Candidatus Colwellbacteria bacterium]